MGEALGGRSVSATPRYIRYKPANKATVLYEIELDHQRTSAVINIKVGDLRKALARPEARSLAASARGRCLSPEPLMFLESPRALVEWYPARLGLPGLVFDVRSMTDQLEASGHPLRDPILVAYKPERRTVERWGSVYVKAYVEDAEYRRAWRGLEAAAALPGIVAPAALGSVPTHRLTVQAEVVAEDATTLPALGQAVARLHSSSPPGGTPWTSPADQLDLAWRTAAQVAWLLPDLEGDLAMVLTALERVAPAPRDDAVVVSHGDLKVDNAVATSTGVALLDFDHMCLAEPASDAANAAAHMVEGGPGDLVVAIDALEELLSGYGKRPRDLLWYLAVSILCRAVYPFRLLRMDWPARIGQMVEHSAELLAA